MTEEFKRQYDYNVKVMKAADYARALGYEEGYYGNLGSFGCENTDYTYRLRKAIKSLVGDKWPEVVMREYSESYHEGFMDT